MSVKRYRLIAGKSYDATKQEPCFRFPAQLIRDIKLSPSARQITLAVFSLLEQDVLVCVPQRRLAALSGLAVSTVNEHLPTLQRKYLNVTKRKARFDRSAGRPRETASVITCEFPERDYVLIPYSSPDKLRRRVIRCTDVPVFLYVRYRMSKAYPGLKKTAKETGLARCSVCNALKSLTAVGLLYIEKCRKVNGAFPCNSYFLLRGRTVAPTRSVYVPGMATLLRSPGGVTANFRTITINRR